MSARNCSRCGGPHDRPDQRYCAACHATYMRHWRKTHPLNPEHHRRDLARHVAGVSKRRGQIVPQACFVCSDPSTEMHHIDHERPHDVTWLCRGCHLAWHAFWRGQVLDVFHGWARSEHQRFTDERSTDTRVSASSAGARAA